MMAACNEDVMSQTMSNVIGTIKAPNAVQNYKIIKLKN